jgi:acyl-coenzyme A synthetase/AMP-(fatty) acid ligase
VQDAPVELLEALAHYGVTHLMATPSLLALLCAFAGRRPEGLRLRVAESGGAPASPGLDEAVRRSLGATLLPVFGATEVGGVAIAPPACEPQRPYSVGLPLPGYEVEVVREDGTPVGAWEDGELVIHGPAVAQSYARCAGVVDQSRLAGGRFRTGDVARRDQDGWIYMRGRISSQFKVGGISVQAEAVEAALARDPDVRAAVVLPVHHSLLGYVPAALIATDGMPPPATRYARTVYVRRLLRRAAPRLETPFLELPRFVKFVPEIPTLGGGKVDRVAARRVYFDELPRPNRVRLGRIGELRGALALVPWRSTLSFLLRRPLGSARVIRRLVGRDKAK